MKNKIKKEIIKKLIAERYKWRNQLFYPFIYIANFFFPLFVHNYVFILFFICLIYAFVFLTFLIYVYIYTWLGFCLPFILCTNQQITPRILLKFLFRRAHQFCENRAWVNRKADALIESEVSISKLTRWFFCHIYSRTDTI